MALHSFRGPVRIVGSNHVISPSEIAAVLKLNGDTRIAVEHILSLLNHEHHPNQKHSVQNYSPKSHIDTPQTALETLEILLQGSDNIFDRRDKNQAGKIALGIMFLFSEYFGNQDSYTTTGVFRDPEEQKYLLIAKQKLTDTFHFIVGNIIDRNFQTSAQFGDIPLDTISQDKSVLDTIANSSEFPNIKRHLASFQTINFGEKFETIMQNPEEIQKAA